MNLDDKSLFLDAMEDVQPLKRATDVHWHPTRNQRAPQRIDTLQLDNFLTTGFLDIIPLSRPLEFRREGLQHGVLDKLRSGKYPQQASLNLLRQPVEECRKMMFSFIQQALADGSTRHVQTYAGPIEIYGDKLMLCIVHDITEQKRLEEQLEHAAHHDAMTGLLNRRQFYHITEPGQMQHLAIAQDYSLLLIDTDRFKHINDLYGHSKGDEVLCALARTLESCARKGDLVFRWGGEEFVLLLPRTPLDTALSLAETIRVSVAKVSISGLPRFTVSIGVAHHEGNESIDELFKRVDDALYRAKNDGRNRVLAA